MKRKNSFLFCCRCCSIHYESLCKSFSCCVYECVPSLGFGISYQPCNSLCCYVQLCCSFSFLLLRCSFSPAVLASVLQFCNLFLFSISVIGSAFSLSLFCCLALSFLLLLYYSSLCPLAVFLMNCFQLLFSLPCSLDHVLLYTICCFFCCSAFSLMYCSLLF